MIWKTFGFENQKKMFEQAIQEQNLGHAYIFAGQDMIGKRYFAREIASCIADKHDVVESKEYSIENVRDVKRSLALSPLNGKYKVLIVDNADLLSDEAQNALLKLIEEPTGDAVLFFVTSKPSVLLATILSRCQEIYFSAHNRDVIMEYLKEKKLNQEQKDFLCNFSAGSIGLLSGNYSNIKKYIEEFGNLQKADINKRFDLAKELAVDDNLRTKVLYWMLYLRTKKMYRYLPSLLELHRTVSYAGYNEQLALENFMLQL